MLTRRRGKGGITRAVQCLCGMLLVSLAASPVSSHEDIEVQVAHLSRRIEAEPGNPALYLHRAELHRIHRDWPAALVDLQWASRINSRLPAVHLSLGRLLLEADFPALALAALDRFLALEPHDSGALLMRARAFLKLGVRRAAVEDFDRGICQLRGPRAPRPDDYLDRARALAAEGGASVDEAIRGLDEGLRRLGGAVALQLLAIDLERSRCRYGPALERLSALEARSPRKEFWLARRGEVLLEAAHPGEARRAFEAALAAIASLPEHRRGTSLTAELEAKIRNSLASLPPPLAADRTEVEQITQH